MKDFFGTIGFVVAGILLVFALMFGSYEAYKFFAPKYRAVDNAVFKESEQYNDGMIRDLENLQMEYTKANADQKTALKDIIIHRFSVYDQNRLPANLWAFYQDLKNGKQ